MRYRRRRQEKSHNQEVDAESSSSSGGDVPDRDSFVEGYVLRFCSDQQGCGYFGLFLEAPGSSKGSHRNHSYIDRSDRFPMHCVLSSVEDPSWCDTDPEEEEGEVLNKTSNDNRDKPRLKPRLTPLERSLGIGISGDDPTDYVLAGPDFESFLAEKYFDHLLVVLEDEQGKRLLPQMKRYLLGIYCQKGRNTI